MTTESPAPDAQRPPDIYARIRRFAPALVVLFCAGILVVVAIVSPFESPSPRIELRDGFVASEGDPVAAYVVIDNTGGGDTLLGASTPIAEQVELQQRAQGTVDDPGELTTVTELPVAGYDETRLQPGSDQLLLTGLTQELRVGDNVELTLRFERAGDLVVQAEVATYLEIADRLLPPRLVVPGQAGDPELPGQ